jgi:hypothetical protein
MKMGIDFADNQEFLTATVLGLLNIDFTNLSKDEQKIIYNSLVLHSLDYHTSSHFSYVTSYFYFFIAAFNIFISTNFINQQMLFLLEKVLKKYLCRGEIISSSL